MHHPHRPAWTGRTVAVVACLALVAGCSGSSGAPHPRPAAPAAVVSEVMPAPAGVIGGAAQSPNRLWVLAGTRAVKGLYPIDPADRSVGVAVPVSKDASSVAESSSNVVAIGSATASTGAIDLYDGSSGAHVTSVPVGAPVGALAFGADGLLYVLNGTTSSKSVSVVNTQTGRVQQNVGVPLGATGLAVDSAQGVFYTVDGSHIDEIPLAKGLATATFSSGDPGTSVALSPNRKFLYLLKTRSASGNIGVFDSATEAMIIALPAAANSVSIAVSPDGQAIYDFVSTPSAANVQKITIPAGER